MLARYFERQLFAELNKPSNTRDMHQINEYLKVLEYINTKHRLD